jgi:hypothetical protein
MSEGTEVGAGAVFHPLPEGKQGFLCVEVAPVNEKTLRDERTIN